MPEYLVLVDRASVRDHQARLIDGLIDRLVVDDVFVARYDFHRDPRLCYPRRPGASPLTLDELAARHPHHRLLIFSDGSGLMSPVTGEPVFWAEQLAHWPGRALLTSEPPEHWGYRELALARGGLAVHPPGPEEGLLSFVDRGRDGPKAVGSRRISSPTATLAHSRERPGGWLDRLAPEPARIDESWFAGAAAFPPWREGF